MHGDGVPSARTEGAGAAARPAVPGIPIEIHTPCPPQLLPPCAYAFPDVRRAPKRGLIGTGGDFEPATIVAAYRAGIFPWPHDEEERAWFSPDPRAIIPVGGLHVSRRLARTVRSGSFRVTLDAAFEQVMIACANRPDGTWITSALIDGYTRLHRLGWAHSFETWSADGTLAGGLYGVGVGAMFGAESMFHRATDASKVAMVAMMQHAERIGLQLIDIQVLTPHTESMGAVEISRVEYLKRLARSLDAQVDWRAAEGGDT
jgi:leucyl/phenylalanyl-tRNA--protein transferase